VATSQLRVGDALRSHDGHWLAVEAVRDTGREEVVYNCRVAEYHTYFVGDEQWGFSVWAHNSCGPGGAPVRPHGIDLEALRPTGTVAAHAAERPYIYSPHTIRNIIELGTPRPDPGGVPGALRWDVPGSFRGSEGTFELAIDLATNRILHFLFRSGRR